MKIPSKTILTENDIKNLEPDLNIVRYLSLEQAKLSECIIFAKEWQVLHLITTNNKTLELKKLKNNLEEKLFKTKIYYTSPSWFDFALKRYDIIKKQDLEKQKQKQKQLEAKWTNAIQMIKDLYKQRHQMIAWDFVMEIIRLSFQAWASDLHFQPEKDKIIMRLRIDWVLHNILDFDHKDFYPYWKKIKFIAWTKMNIDYIPQDWRFSVNVIWQNWQEKKIDVRASFMPWIKSESIVLRFLDSTKAIQNFENLWFEWTNLKLFKKALNHHFGLILITWPTWSWKTTTLYSALQTKNNWTNKIITLEDPVEYNISWIQQSQINYKKWYDYAQWLKACMRHDPDIILVWETRTLETAQTVVNAALTWHLVFTTLHTNNSLEAVTRLLSMWIKSYMLAPSLIMIQAQRLVRKVCQNCKQNRKATKSENEFILQTLENIKKYNPDEYSRLWKNFKFDWTIPSAIWCKECNNLWYKWRTAVMETLYFDDELKEAINDNITEKELLKIARKKWFLTIQENAVIKMLQWQTTIEEVRKLI